MQTESDPRIRIARIIAGLLLLQISRIRRETDPVAATIGDDFSAGYVFGFVDVMTQRVGFADPDEGFRIFAVLAKALFGRDAGEGFCARLLARQHAPETIWGASTGRSDSRSWLKDPTIPPLGWVHYCRGDPEDGLSATPSAPEPRAP